MSEAALLHGVAVPRAAGGAALLGGLRPLVGPFDPPVARVDGPDELLARAAEGLPAGAARDEAIAVRLRRLGVPLRWGEPVALEPAELVAWSERRGRSSIAVLRADPSLLTELQLGAYHHAAAAGRAARRALLRLPLRPWMAARRPRALRALADAAFWRGVRVAAGDAEWERLTRGYAALLYHRLAGEMKPGQERLDLPPEQFAAQMRLLRRLGFCPLSLADAIRVHHDGAAPPRRAVLVTADDGFADCAAVFAVHGSWHPALFVPTRAVGGPAPWADGAPIADWPALEAVRAAGGELGAHSRSHVDLTRLEDTALEDEVGGALRDLVAAVPPAPRTFAYPHGRHDLRVREATRAADAVLAFTSAVGSNGAGTDPWCLRRVGIKAYDSLPAVAYKALTGELLPGRWERRLLRRARAGALPSSRPAAAAAAGRPHPAPPPPPQA